MKSDINTEKFADDGTLYYEFGNEFLVVCPRCSGTGKVFATETESEKLSKKLFAPRKFICFECVHRAEWNGGTVRIGGNFDWYFWFPLRISVSCCGKELWAYNEKHLEFIEKYVAAKLRERKPNINKSVASRLPSWIKQAKNRDEILKAIAKLREILNGKS